MAYLLQNAKGMIYKSRPKRDSFEKNPEDDILTIHEVAEIMKCHPRTISRRYDFGLTPIKDGGIVRIRRCDLNVYLEKMKKYKKQQKHKI